MINGKICNLKILIPLCEEIEIDDNSSLIKDNEDCSPRTLNNLFEDAKNNKGMNCLAMEAKMKESKTVLGPLSTFQTSFYMCSKYAIMTATFIEKM